MPETRIPWALGEIPDGAKLIGRTLLCLFILKSLTLHTLLQHQTPTVGPCSTRETNICRTGRSKRESSSYGL